MHVTLLFLRRDGEILLAMKKRGFGAGKWNGVGGKLEPGETPLAAAVRECHEEIDVIPKNLHKCCEIDFYQQGDVTFNHYVHVYTTTQWEGEPRETDEMRPKWFALADIPYNDMWRADKSWLPLLLEGVHFKAKLVFDTDERVVESKIANVKEFTV